MGIEAVWVILNFFWLFFSSTRRIDYIFRQRKKYHDFFRRWLFGKRFFRRRKKSPIIFFADEKNAALLSRHVEGLPQSDFRRGNRSISQKRDNVNLSVFVKHIHAF